MTTLKNNLGSKYQDFMAEEGDVEQAKVHNTEFAHWDSYLRFAHHVRSVNRYVLGEEQKSFLNTVLATIVDREIELKKGMIFYRAQLGVDWHHRKDTDGNTISEDMLGFGASRMKPLKDRAKEGRANSSGIPVLYVATTAKAAISEVRPWIGADVSVAECKLLRSLRTLDLSIDHGKSSFSGPIINHLLHGQTLTAQDKERAVWIDIDNAFSTPVTQSDDRADYVPTQILTELFRSVGYDAIAYKSHFEGDTKQNGFNIAIFDLNAVKIVSCSPYNVEKIEINAQQVGNAWFSSSQD